MIRRFSLFLSLVLGISATVSALPVSSYTTSSRLSKGTWVKIRTDKEAIYQLTYDQLRGLGFSDPSKVQVYGYGALTLSDNQFSTGLPDDLQPVTTRHTPDGRILFYGEGDVRVASNKINQSVVFATYKRSWSDTASYYFLSDSEDVEDVPVRNTRQPSSATATPSHLHIDWQEEELQSPTGGGSVYHGKTYSPGDKAPFSFRIKNYSPVKEAYNGENAMFSYVFGVFSSVQTRLSSSASPNVKVLDHSGTDSNVASSGNNSTERYRDATGYLPFTSTDSDPLQDSQVDFTVNIPTEDSDKMGYCGADRVYITYPRDNRLDAEDPYLVMNFIEGRNLGGQTTLFNGTTTDALEVWNIDTPWKASAYPLTYDADIDAVKMVFDVKAYRAVAFNPTLTFPTPEIEGAVAPQNLHGSQTPEMLIITTEEMRPYADRLASLHRSYQNMDVLVVNHKDIYNEFSSGARSSMAYRRLAKMFYDRDSRKFKYLLFFGPASLDNRGLFLTPGDRMVCHSNPDPKQANNFILNYPIDSFFGMMNDKLTTDDSIEQEPVQIAVGRISALNTSQAAIYVDKVAERFEHPIPAEVYGNAMLVSGVGDNDTHVKHQIQVRGEMEKANSDLSFRVIPIEHYPSKTLAADIMSSHLKQGTGYMTYSGHGGPTYIDAWSVASVGANSYTYPTFVMLSSCDQFAFDMMHGGLVESMLFEPDGGALAGIAASRSVYISYNQASCMPVARAYAAAKPGAVFGDIYKDARNQFIAAYKKGEISYSSPSTAFRNMLAYNLAGDPAVPVGVAENKAVLTGVGEVALGTAVPNVKPFVPTMFRGEIRNANGSVNTSFNGTARVTVYDSDIDIPIITERKENNVVVYDTVYAHIDNEVLAFADTKVTAGKFAVEMTLPIATNPESYNRLSITANSDDGVRAIGALADVNVTDYDADAAVTEFKAPVIKQFYITDADGNPTDEIGATGYACALIDPTAEGLNFRTGAIATAPRLTLDGVTPFKILPNGFTYQENGEYVMQYPLNALAEGAHTLSLKVAGNAGLAAEATLDFNVVTRSLQPELFVDEATATAEATIGIDGTAPEYCRLIITDDKGETRLSVENPRFPYKWNLQDTKGNAVADGTYNASVLVRKGRDYGSSATTRIVVLR